MAPKLQIICQNLRTIYARLINFGNCGRRELLYFLWEIQASLTEARDYKVTSYRSSLFVGEDETDDFYFVKKNVTVDIRWAGYFLYCFIN